MKIAIIHDWLVTNGGAERVLKCIFEIYPNADIFSLVDFLDKDDRAEILNNKFAKTSFIQKLPFAKKYFRHYLPLFPTAIESLNLSQYDLLISSSWAVAKGVKKHENQTHICYCHTPIRYAWDLYDEYISNLSGLKKLLVKLTLSYIKKWDIKSLARVDFFIANSNFVKERIERIYKKEAKVIYPPVKTENFIPKEIIKKHYITISRLVPYKKTKLIVKAFNQMPDLKLIVIGQGEELKEIKSIAKENIAVLGYQKEENLISLLQSSYAFVYAAIEDFGIVLAQALSCGIPVVGLNKGGSKEIISDKKYGILFEKQEKTDIIQAIRKMQKDYSKFNKFDISSYAARFSSDIFKDKFSSFVEEKCK